MSVISLIKLIIINLLYEFNPTFIILLKNNYKVEKMDNNVNNNESSCSGYYFNEYNQKHLIKISFIDEKIEFGDTIIKEIYFSNIKSIKKISEEVIADYSEIAAKYTAFVIFIIMFLYNAFIGDSLVGAVLGGVISALIWGGIAFIVGKFIKVKYPRLMLITFDGTKFEVAISVIDMERIYLIINFDINVKNNTSMLNIENNNRNGIYDDLYKLKELLDQNIITDEEFENQKRKLLSKL